MITIVQLRTRLCVAVVADDTFSTNVNMVFSADHILIENLYKFKNYGAKKLIREFPTKGWSVSSVNKLLKKLRDTGITARRAARKWTSSKCAHWWQRTSTPLKSWFWARKVHRKLIDHSSNSKGNRHPSFVGVPHCSPGSQAKMPEETSRRLAWLVRGLGFINKLSTKQSTSGANDCKPAWKLADGISNTCFDCLWCVLFLILTYSSYLMLIYHTRLQCGDCQHWSLAYMATWCLLELPCNVYCIRRLL